MLRWLLPCSTRLPPIRWKCQSGPRRELFSFPDFSSLSPFGPETQKYHERKILPYRQKELYDIVADVGSYPTFVPFCTGSRIIDSPFRKSEHDRNVMEAELTVGFLSFRESYVSKVTCKPYESVEAVASSSTPLFKTLSTTWRFQPASSHSLHSPASVLKSHKDDHPYSGPTLVTLDLAYAFANPIHASVSSAFFGQVSKLMVKAFEERCLEVYGTGQE